MKELGKRMSKVKPTTGFFPESLTREISVVTRGVSNLLNSRVRESENWCKL